MPTGRPRAALTFRPTERRRLKLVDRGHITNQYPPGSLGDYNGMNYAEADMPEDGIEGLARLLVAQHR